MLLDCGLCAELRRLAFNCPKRIWTACGSGRRIDRAERSASPADMNGIVPRPYPNTRRTCARFRIGSVPRGNLGWPKGDSPIAPICPFASPLQDPPL